MLQTIEELDTLRAGEKWTVLQVHILEAEEAGTPKIRMQVYAAKLFEEELGTYFTQFVTVVQDALQFADCIYELSPTQPTLLAELNLLPKQNGRPRTVDVALEVNESYRSSAQCETLVAFIDELTHVINIDQLQA